MQLSVLLAFVLPAALVLSDHHCRMVTEEKIMCEMKTKEGCEPVCSIEQVPAACHEVKVQECQTEHEEVCGEARHARKRRSLPLLGAGLQVGAPLAIVGNPRHLGLFGLLGLLGIKHHKLNPVSPIVPLAVGAAAVPLAVGAAAAAAAVVAARKRDRGTETCFEIPRTVCPSAGSHNCETHTETVCGLNDPTKRRRRSTDSAEEADGECDMMPAAQRCVMKKPTKKCDSMKSEKVCHPSAAPGCELPEADVCSPMRFTREVCD